VALIDLLMPLTDGITLMEQLRQRNPELAVIIMTGFGTIETAVDAIKRGAEDYLTKPFDQETVRKKIGRLMEVFELRQRVAQLEASMADCCRSFESVIYVSPAMHRVVERARHAAASDAALLLLGETGTGKELLARAIHGASRRAGRPFVPVNCGALPHELVESEMFGVRRGAFTGAYADAPGLFLSAHGGTIFLDEIGEMPKDAQVKLLRTLQDGELRPVGGRKAVRVDVRVIAATNRPLPQLREERLREDLYFRIATVVLEIPPLRQRREDVLVLARHFTAQLTNRYGRAISLCRPAAELLVNYAFPGNVRELESLLESAAAVSTEDPQGITDKDLKPLLTQRGVTAESLNVAAHPLSLEETERLAIERALRVCQGNRTRAAHILGISRDTLYRRLHEFAEPQRTVENDS
jgi:two-component system response regulator HydG